MTARDPEYWRAHLATNAQIIAARELELSDPVLPPFAGLPTRGGWLGPPPPCEGRYGHPRMYGSDTCESTRGEIVAVP
jgi:hypothetical protein